jgi:hypothetical protein
MLLLVTSKGIAPEGRSRKSFAIFAARFPNFSRHPQTRSGANRVSTFKSGLA